MALGQAIPERRAELVVNMIAACEKRGDSPIIPRWETDHIPGIMAMLRDYLSLLGRPAHGLAVEQIDRCFALCSCKEDSDGPCAVCDYLIGVRKDALDRPGPAPVITAGELAAFEDGRGPEDKQCSDPTGAVSVTIPKRDQTMTSAKTAPSTTPSTTDKPSLTPAPDLAALAARYSEWKRSQAWLAPEFVARDADKLLADALEWAARRLARELEAARAAFAKLEAAFKPPSKLSDALIREEMDGLRVALADAREGGK